MRTILENTDEPSADEILPELEEGSSAFGEDLCSSAFNTTSHPTEYINDSMITIQRTDVNVNNVSPMLSYHACIKSSSSVRESFIDVMPHADHSKKTEINRAILPTTVSGTLQQCDNLSFPDTSVRTETSVKGHRPDHDEPGVVESENKERHPGLTEHHAVETTQQGKSFSTGVPEYLQLLDIGELVNGDSYLPLDSKPHWFDVEKYRRGQKFAQDYFFGLVFAEMLSLMLLFLFPENLKPLIYTGKSDTPFKAFKRYLSTVIRVKSWYEGDIWKESDEAHRNLRVVRDMHEAYRTRLNNCDPKSIDEKCTLKTPLWSELSDKLREDFRSSCPVTGICPYSRRDNAMFINQADMAVTQFGFVGLMVLYPGAFGAAWASDEDLEGFIHLWQCIGYLLGIDDRFNFCAGDLATVRQRSRDLIELRMKPKLHEVDHPWEHMYRCVTEGISYYVPWVTFEVSLLYLCRVLGIQSPHLESALTKLHRFLYSVTIVVMRYLLLFPPYRAFSNWLLRSSIKQANVPSASWIRERQERRYSYQVQNGGTINKSP